MEVAAGGALLPADQAPGRWGGPGEVVADEHAQGDAVAQLLGEALATKPKAGMRLILCLHHLTYFRSRSSDQEGTAHQTKK